MIRLMQKKDLDEVVDIFGSAKNIMRDAGIDQWQDHYPDVQIIREDIAAKRAYILEKDGVIQSVGTIYFDIEKDYEEITEGFWKFPGKYATVHRLCTNMESQQSGRAVELMKFFFRLSSKNNCHSIRIDTHEDNIPMKNLIGKLGFCYAGIVYIRGTDRRVVYERKL